MILILMLAAALCWVAVPDHAADAAEKKRAKKRLEARIEAARLAMRPVELSRYTEWGLLYELELDAMGMRNIEYLRRMMGE